MNRHKHVADIVLAADLNGFTHAELALLSAVVRRAGDRHADIRALAAIGGTETKVVERAAIILSLADAIEARCARDQTIAIRSEVNRNVTLSIPALTSWLENDLGKRFERVFGRELIVRH